MDKVKGGTDTIPEWIIKRAEVLQFLKDKGLSLEDIRFITENNASGLDYEDAAGGSSS